MWQLKIAEEYFATLRQRIDESSSYLEKAKKDLENINFTFQRERLNEDANNFDYDDFMNKSDEEIDAEMESIKAQLASLEAKVTRLNKNTNGAEENFNQSIKILENISNGIYSDEYHEDDL